MPIEENLREALHHIRESMRLIEEAEREEYLRERPQMDRVVHPIKIAAHVSEVEVLEAEKSHWSNAQDQDERWIDEINREMNR